MTSGFERSSNGFFATMRDSNRKLRLYIDGGLHATRPEKRIEKIEEVLPDVDVVFVEDATIGEVPLYSKLLNFVAVPVLILPLYLHLVVLDIWGFISSKDDGVIVYHFEDNHGAEVVPTDRGLHQLLEDGRLVWFLGHAVVVLLAFLAIPMFIGEVFSWMPPALQLIMLFLVTGAGLSALFLAGTLSARNLQIVRDIERRALADGPVDACLITGTLHEPGIREELDSSDHVKLVGESKDADR